MIAGSLVWGSPQYFWPIFAFALVFLLVLAWSYLRSPGSRQVRLSAGVLKALGVAALLLTIIEPLNTDTRLPPDANLFVVLTDTSRSMQIKDKGSRVSRAEILEKLLQKESPWLAKLNQDFDVRFFSFDERLRSLKTDEDLSFSGNASSLAKALKTLFARFQERPLAGILVLTDGSPTDGGLQKKGDWSRGPAVYPVPIGESLAIEDVNIQEVTVSQTNFEEAPVTVSAKIATLGLAGEKVTVKLSDESGRALKRQAFDITEKENQRILRFQLKPEKPGVNFFHVHASLEKDVPSPDQQEAPEEATLENNRAAVSVYTPKGPYRVLYVTGRPNWEFKFLRRAVQDDRELALVGLIRIAKKEPKFTFMGHTGESSNPLFRGFVDEENEDLEQYDQPVLMRIGTRDETELRDGFPRDKADLFGYAAVILDDMEAKFFTQDQLLLLHKFVSQRGGALLMLGGVDSFQQGGYRRTPIDELLPVYLDGPRKPDPDGRYQLKLTREGWIQPWVRLRKTEAEEEKNLSGMPLFESINPVKSIKPGAAILSQVVDASSGNDLPALVVQRFGKGRTGALLVADMWRWQMQRRPDRENDLARAWRQMVRWLVSDVPRPIELNIASDDAQSAGAPVALLFEVRDPEFNPMDNVSVNIEIKAPDDKVYKLKAAPHEDMSGTYRATFLPRQSGAYRVHAQVVALDGSVVGEREAGWTSDPGAHEFRRLKPDLSILSTIAEESGGRMVKPDDLDGFVHELPHLDIPIKEPWVYPFWHQWPFFLFAIFCLIAEWGIRRLKGLP